MKHATNPDGIPLIGIHPQHTEEVCDGCGVTLFLTKIELFTDRFLCENCKKKDNTHELHARQPETDR